MGSQDLWPRARYCHQIRYKYQEGASEPPKGREKVGVENDTICVPEGVRLPAFGKHDFCKRPCRSVQGTKPSSIPSHQKFNCRGCKIKLRPQQLYPFKSAAWVGIIGQRYLVQERWKNGSHVIRRELEPFFICQQSSIIYTSSRDPGRPQTTSWCDGSSGATPSLAAAINIAICQRIARALRTSETD